MPSTTRLADCAAADDLLTIRDLLRYGVSRFTAAGLVYGHGTTRALDEAAFLILETLHLPIDELEPWLEARLTRGERERLLELFEERIATRKPACYLTRSAYIQGHRFYVDERVIVPRSYLGELLGGDLSHLIGRAGEITSVLDLCTGSGCLAILAALAFPSAVVEAVDISGDALEVARRNVADYGLEERVRLYRGGLLAPLGRRRFDLILSNPPYVPAAAMAALPPEFQAEPALALAGGEDGLDIVRRILAGAARHLAPQGHLIVEIGTGRESLEQAYPDLPFLWLDTEASEGEVFHLPAAALTG